MKRRIDNQAVGFIIGVLAPLIAFLIVIKYVYPQHFVDEELKSMWLSITVPRILSLAAIPNLASFFLFIYTNNLKAARGVLGATIVLAVIIFIIKLN